MEDLDVNSVLSNDFILLSEVLNLDSIELYDRVPNIQCISNQIELQTCSASNPTMFLDHKGLPSSFGEEMELISKVDALVESGHEFVHILYAYRPVSRALPEIPTEIPEGLSKDELDEMMLHRNEINRKVVDILRPEILKMKDLMVYVLKATNFFHDAILHLATFEQKQAIVPEGLHVSLLKLIDVLVKLDNLKDMKPSLQNDFSRYKRAVRSNLSAESIEEQAQIQSFLCNPDARKTKNFIFQSLRDEVKRIVGHEDILIELLTYAADAVDKAFFVLPDEKFCMLRVLPHLILLIDGDMDDPKSLNIFKTYRGRLIPVQKLCRRFPVVPLYGDMAIIMVYILQRTCHFDSKALLEWGAEEESVAGRQPTQATSDINYKLSTSWESIRVGFTDYSVRLTHLLNSLKLKAFEKTSDEENCKRAKEVYDLSKEGLLKLSKWTCLIYEAVAWKITHPCSLERLKELNTPDCSPGIEYERAIRYNFSKEEFNVFADIVSMIKSLASSLNTAETVFAPIIRFHVHHCVQQLVQGDLMPLLHRVDKRRLPLVANLLQIRMLVADWPNGVEPREDYKQYHRKQGPVHSIHPARVVSTSITQLHILRAQVRTLYKQQKTGIFGSSPANSSIDAADQYMLNKFYEDSFFFPYIVDFSNCLRSVSCLGDLWFREFFLELTRCVQFPIDMSLPWLLTEQVISQQSLEDAPMIENILFTMDIYNDAAHKALFVLNQQHLYDEIEAEVNLVFDQLVFSLAEEIYKYYKNLAASDLLDKPFKHKMEELKDSADGRHLSVRKRRFEVTMAQRHVQLLGRTVNLCYLLAQHINSKMSKDLEVVLRKFEVSDFSGITELQTLLSILQRSHGLMSEVLQLDIFHMLFNEANESFSPSSFKNRISFHVLRTLVTDLFPNYSYNLYTHRFVKSPIKIRPPMEYGKAPKQSVVNQTYGMTCCKAYEAQAKLTRGYVGRVHVEALVALHMVTDICMVVAECMKNLSESLKVASDYLGALNSGMASMELPKRSSGFIALFKDFEERLTPLLGYDDLKPEVFQSFREIGNTIAFMKDLSDVLELNGVLDYINLCPFTGTPPDDVPFHMAGAPPPSDKQMPAKGDTAPNDGMGSGSNSVSAACLHSPLGSLLLWHSSAMIQQHPNVAAQVLLTDTVITQLPELADRLVTNMTQTLAAHHSHSLFKGVLIKMEDFLYQLNLYDEWGKLNKKGPSISRAMSNCDMASSTAFHRSWSALNFLFCLSTGMVAPVTEGKTDDELYDLIPDADEFGHGFAIAGALLLHLLEQDHLFPLLDPSYTILSMCEYELNSLSSQESLKSDALDSVVMEAANDFIDRVAQNKDIFQEMFALFAVQHVNHSTGTASKKKITKFEPMEL